jgi:hypothetical protein
MPVGIQVGVGFRNKLVIVTFVLGMIQKKVAFGVYVANIDFVRHPLTGATTGLNR